MDTVLTHQAALAESTGLVCVEFPKLVSPASAKHNSKQLLHYRFR